MIDRASYMGVLTGDAGDKLKELEEEFRKAVKRATGANADAASAKWIQDQLDDAVKERVEALDKL